MESKIFCLVAFLALSAGVAYTQAQSNVTEEIDTNTTTVASPSNATEPNTTVSSTIAPTTAVPSTVPSNTVPSSAVPSTEVPTTARSNTTGEVPTEVTTANTAEAFNGTTTLTPPSTTSTPCTPHSFDAASFVGGIVLGLGVCIIVFFVYKWYQSRHPTAAPYQQF